MSGGLAPSRSTVYASNLSYSLTNNDLHKIFSRFGPVVKVTLVKDRETRKSKGVAFVQFKTKDGAKEAIGQMNAKVLFGRTWKVNWAKDNGRAAEFIRRKNYPDKSFCFECGEEGHMSYSCPKNSLGRRTPPPKKERRKKTPKTEEKDRRENSEEKDSDECEEEEDLETLSAAIQLEQAKVMQGTSTDLVPRAQRKPRIKKSTYFSDEEEENVSD